MRWVIRHRVPALVVAAALVAIVLSAWLGRGSRGYAADLDPGNPDGSGAQAVARVLGASDAGHTLVADIRARLAALADRTRALPAPRPTVACLEWIDPLPGGMDSVGGLDMLKGWLQQRKLAYSPAARLMISMSAADRRSAAVLAICCSMSRR